MGVVEVAVAVLCGVAVLAAVAFGAVRRRARGEAHSVARYRQTLDVLGHLGGGDRDLRGQEEGSEGPRATPYQRPRTVEPVSVGDHGTERSAGPPAATLLSAQSLPSAPSAAEPLRRDRSLMAMERPARRLGVPAVALVVLLAAAGSAAYLVVRAHHGGPPPKRQASSHAKGRKATLPTLPARYTPVSTTTSSATYALRSSTYSLTIGATTSDCWMSVTEANGTTVLAQTFAAGATASLTLTGHASIVIGAPNSASVTVDHVPLVLPAGIAGPFTVTLAVSTQTSTGS